ncbi:hypothetical protein CR513_30855, partial [Mucuna pruriens]
MFPWTDELLYMLHQGLQHYCWALNALTICIWLMMTSNRPMIVVPFWSMEACSSMRGFYLKKNICVLKSSIKELLVKESCEGGLMGQFGLQKTYEALHEHFYWP